MKIKDEREVEKKKQQQEKWKKNNNNKDRKEHRGTKATVKG